MKAVRTFILGIMMLVSTSMIAQPMNYNAIRNNARFLTDRMAYTLGISNLALIDDIYRINYDYIFGLNEYLDDIALGYRYDDYMEICAERDFALRMLLGDILWNRLIGYDYFYRPIVFHEHRWHFGIYLHDYDRGHYHFGVPRYYDGYRGGHFFGGMRPTRGIGDRGPGMANWGPRDTRPGHIGAGGHHDNRGGYQSNMNPGNVNNRGQHGGGYNNRGDNRPGGMNQGGANNSHRGENRPGGMNQGGANNSYREDNRPGGMNQGGANNTYRGENRPGGMNQGGANNTYRGDMRDNNSSINRSQSNMQSSSRSSSYGSYSSSSRSSSDYTPSRSSSDYSSSRSSSSSYSSPSRSSSDYSPSRSSSSYSSPTRSSSSSSSSYSSPSRSSSSSSSSSSSYSSSSRGGGSSSMGGSRGGGGSNGGSRGGRR